MAHISDSTYPLQIKQVPVRTRRELLTTSKGLNDVCVIRLPACKNPKKYTLPLNFVGELIAEIAKSLGPSATLVVLGEVIDLVQVQAHMSPSVRYQHWIAVGRNTTQIIDGGHLPHQHFGALVHTRYMPSLRHTKTRIRYTYCPVCDKTTKDYGGKKHTYHEVGTLISDVWRDISCDLDGDIGPIINRFADLFGMEPYKNLTLFDCSHLKFRRAPFPTIPVKFKENSLPKNLSNRILNGDCLNELRRIPSNSVDFAFADPPYNLGKKYIGYKDDLEIQDYFNWCDKWIEELARTLKPGRTLALLNIPLWAIRHFLHMQKVLTFQNWIVWDALAFPVRLVMPAHYSILCFTKGKPRNLPGLTKDPKNINVLGAPRTFNPIKPLAYGYCLRSDCIGTRERARINDRAPLADLWGDIHRLKHNSRRVDHPCQLPAHLMNRLISIFTNSEESVLDCFNGAGTTTLTAHQLDRKYIGIDSSKKYCKMAEKRHSEIVTGLDPFRKEERVLTSKNSPVPRLPKQIYKVPKKTLQLEVKRVAKKIGHVPSRDELIKYGRYSIDYYDKYFAGWGEVTAAARTTGMTEKRIAVNGEGEYSFEQLPLLEAGF